MGQARKTPKKAKETKEDVLKREITAAVNRRTTAKINEVRAMVEDLEEKIKSHFQHHEEGAEHTHANLESRMNNLERRLLDMIEDLRSEVNKLRHDKRELGEQPPSPSPF